MSIISTRNAIHGRKHSGIINVPDSLDVSVPKELILSICNYFTFSNE